MHDIEIKNASIIDGLGNEAYQGNLYVKDKKISAITYGETPGMMITNFNS